MAIIAASVFLGQVDAQAAAVNVRPHPEPVYGNEIMYEAAPGERNRVVLREVDGGGGGLPSFVVSDAGAPLTPGRWCTALDEHTVQCAPQGDFGNPVWGYRIVLGDRNDELHRIKPAKDFFRAWPVVAYGGEGDDVLLGADGDDDLDGGEGRDELLGDDGEDVLSDGDRDDGGGTSGPVTDVVDGGSGRDTVSYRQRTARVVVDLGDARGDGARGERDRLRSVESIIGGQGADRLAGDHGPNRIDGQDGRDRLIGRGGDDEFVLGGRPISCGPGGDIVHGHATRYLIPGPLESLQRDCETFKPDYSNLTPSAYPAAVSSRSLSYRIRCPGDSYDGVVVCSGTLRLREAARHRRLLASGAFPRGAWTDRRVRTRLTPLGRRLASSRRGVAAIVRIGGHNIDAPVRWTIRLKVPR